MSEHSEETHFVREVGPDVTVHAVTREGIVEHPGGGISLEVEMAVLVQELEEELRKRGESVE